MVDFQNTRCSSAPVPIVRMKEQGCIHAVGIYLLHARINTELTSLLSARRKSFEDYHIIVLTCAVCAVLYVCLYNYTSKPVIIAVLSE